MSHNLEDLPVHRSEKTTKACSFYHILNLLWHPILRYIETLGTSKHMKWSKALAQNHEALCREMEGIVCAFADPLPVDDWFEFIQKKLHDLVGVEVNLQVIKDVLSTVAPHELETTPANAYMVLRSSLCNKFVGTSLGTQVSRKILAEISENPVPLISQQELNLGITRDLVATLSELHCRPSQEDLENDQRPS